MESKNDSQKEQQRREREVKNAIKKIMRQLEAEFLGLDLMFARTESNAEVPLSARRDDMSEEEHLLETVRGLLYNLTPAKFDVLKSQLINSSILTPDILKSVTALICEKAISEPVFCPMYAVFFSDLNDKLPPLPSNVPGWRGITFKLVLLYCCQEAFERAVNLKAKISKMIKPEQEVERNYSNSKVKLQFLETTHLIAELLKQNMVPEMFAHHVIQKLLVTGIDTSPDEESVVAICEFFNTIGKLLDESSISCQINDIYFIRLKDFSSDANLEPLVRAIVFNVVCLRATNSVPNPEDENIFAVADKYRFLNLMDALHVIPDIDDYLELDVCDIFEDGSNLKIFRGFYVMFQKLG